MFLITINYSVTVLASNSLPLAFNSIIIWSEWQPGYMQVIVHGCVIICIVKTGNVDFYSNMPRHPVEWTKCKYVSTDNSGQKDVKIVC